jgi:hypothetical protein
LSITVLSARVIDREKKEVIEYERRNVKEPWGFFSRLGENSF